MGSLMQMVFDRVQNLRMPELSKIEADTGIRAGWLYQFKRGHIKDPSVNTVQKLYEYFTGKALEI